MTSLFLDRIKQNLRMTVSPPAAPDVETPKLPETRIPCSGTCEWPRCKHMQAIHKPPLCKEKATQV